MTARPQQLPEPLADFAPLAAQLGSAIAQLESARQDLNQARQAGRLLPNSLEALRIELTYNSNAIEGNTLTLRETQLVIEGHSPGGKPLREIYEARNHDRALRMIEQRAQSLPVDSPISAKDILDVHSLVLADIDPANAGRFRDGRVLIAGSGFVPPGPHRFDQLIPTLLELANRLDSHPILAAAELHYNLVATHPFTDGNGRTARLMMNDLLLRRGFPYCIIEARHRDAYLRSLDEANAGRLLEFAQFVLQSAHALIQRILG